MAGIDKMLNPNYVDSKTKWRQNNKEHISTYNKQYWSENKDRIIEKRYESRHKNKFSFS